MSWCEFHCPGGELPQGIVGGLLPYWRGDQGHLRSRCYWSIGPGLLPEAPVAESTGAPVIRIVSALDAAAVCASELCSIESVSRLSRSWSLGSLDEDAVSWPGPLGTVVGDVLHFNVLVK